MYEELVSQCIDAVATNEPRRAVREVLDRALTDGRLAARFETPKAGLTVLYSAPELTVVNVVWPPRFSIFPHDHRMWAAIAIYAGREDNTFYRRAAGELVPSGGKELVDGDVALLGDDTIHAVSNPARSYTGAIHVYGGDFLNTPRSQWDATTLQEQPYDLDAVRRAFDHAEKLLATEE